MPSPRFLPLLILGLCAACAELPDTGAQAVASSEPYPQLINTSAMMTKAAELGTKDTTALASEAESLRARAAQISSSSADEDAARAASLLKKAEEMRAISAN